MTVIARILDAPELGSERQDDESPEAFVMRKALEASGLPDQLRGAVAALAKANGEVAAGGEGGGKDE